MQDRFDLGLIEAARVGEPSALERLLVECQPELRRYAQRSCLISDVDDAVQEALIIASRYLSGLRHTRAWSRWMFRIVRRECHRMARVTLRRDLWGDGDVDALVAVRSQDELRLDLAAAFESLPQQYREVLVLRDFEGLTIGEMAERLATSAAAIKGRLHRARELVREYLLASGDSEVSAHELDHDRVAPPAEVLAGSRESSARKLRRWRAPTHSDGRRGNG
ncbi:MAG: sigma-70 family RNA polymerase sigma factor [Myxococcales bacterium]